MRSPSDIAKRLVPSEVPSEIMPIYYHWFALEALLTTIKAQENSIEVSCNQSSQLIERSHINEVLSTFTYIRNIPTLQSEYYSTKIKSRELTVTSQLARAIDTFLFKHARVYKSYMLQYCHQMPTGLSIMSNFCLCRRWAGHSHRPIKWQYFIPFGV